MSFFSVLKAMFLRSAVIGTGPILVAFVALSTGIGCAHSPEDSVRKFYASDYPGCDPETVAVAANPSHFYFDIEGCGDQDAYYRFCVSDTCKYNPVSEALEMAEFQTGCSMDQITWKAFDGASVAVTACEHRLVYRTTLTGWVLNSESTPTPASTPAN